MAKNVPNWWTDDRVDSTVNREYIYSHLRVNEQELLKQSPSFGAGLTDDTYLDWILTRAKRFFLTLVDCGVPDQIFGIVDESWDDGDLPIPQETIAELRLSYTPDTTLDKRFYKSQFRYLIRVLEDGEHIRYAEEETVPVYASGLKASILSLTKDGVDKVRLPPSTSQYFVRKKIALENRTNAVSETTILSEIASVKKYSHTHILSVFGSYLYEDTMFVLFAPAPTYSLKSFLSDVPKAFENLSKVKRRQILLSWSHCLASALVWLHTNGSHHGAIRPSNIQVDEYFHIFLGQFDNPGILGTQSKVDDIEAYQYAAPERWKRAVTMQTTAPSNLVGHSGGRTARRTKPGNTPEGGDSERSHRSSWSSELPRLDTSNPTSTTYAYMPTSRGNFSRLQLSKSNNSSLISDSTSKTANQWSGDVSDRRNMPSSVLPHHKSMRSEAPSTISSASSRSNHTIKAVAGKSIYVAAPDVKTAVVQTWKSAQYDLCAADVFSMGAIIMDILTLLCKRSAGSFSRFRSSKNRTAGRGGGLADASFHANIGQVLTWGNQLQGYAADRAKKDECQAFRAVGPIVQLVIHCLERDPQERLGSSDMEKRLWEYISTFAGFDYLHCTQPPTKEDLTASLTNYHSDAMSITDQSVATTMEDSAQHATAPFNVPRRDEWAKLRSQGLATATIPSPRGPESSFSSLSSFNFSTDAASDTMVEGSSVTSETTRSTWQGGNFHSNESNHEIAPASGMSQKWDNWHNNDSGVDPRLVKQTNSQSFSFADESGSESDFRSHDVHGHSFLLPSTRPSSLSPPHPPPTKKLPDPPGQGKAEVDESIRHSVTASIIGQYQHRSSGVPKNQASREGEWEEDFHRLSMQNSGSPKEGQPMHGRGQSFMKNI